jgi:hypothetical protein
MIPIEWVGLFIVIGLSALGIAWRLGKFSAKFDKLDKLDKIGEDIGEIKTHAKQIMTSIDRHMDRLTDIIEMYVSKVGTVEKELKNIGKVKITADVGEASTKYYIEIEKPIIKERFIVRKWKESKELSRVEKEFFGEEEVVVGGFPRLLTLTLPSADPKICSSFMASFLEWLDKSYWKSLEEIREFEEFDFFRETSSEISDREKVLRETKDKKG